MWHAVHLVAVYLPGTRNILVDHLIRTFLSRHKWSLHLQMVSLIFLRWGIPQVGLFASRQNRKCYVFCLIRGWAGAPYLIPWLGVLMYTFPPVPLIHRVLLKIRMRIILIAPRGLASTGSTCC